MSKRQFLGFWSLFPLKGICQVHNCYNNKGLKHKYLRRDTVNEGSRRISVAETKKRLHGRGAGSERTWRLLEVQAAEVWAGALLGRKKAGNKGCDLRSRG